MAKSAESANDFYLPPHKEIIFAQNFSNVRCYIYCDGKKWSDTNCVGNLRLIKVADVPSLPVVVVRLNPVDLLGKE